MYDELIGQLRANGELFVKYIPNAEGEILLQAADAIENLICMVADEHNARLDAEERQRWIPAAERLPEYGKHVLVYAGFFQPYIEGAYYCEDRKWRFTYDDAEVVGVSHWMTLPQPPKEET